MKFKCLGESCLKNCCGAFNGIVNSINPITGHHSSEIVLSADNVKFMKKNGYKDNIYKDKDNKWFMLLNKDKSCPMFYKGKCSIYYNRPPVCRAYPFYLDTFSGINIDTNCEGVTITTEKLNVEDYEQEMNGLKEVIELQLNTNK
jgi:Fe-S-cluster containining protein